MKIGINHVLFTPEANLEARQASFQSLGIFSGSATNQGA